MNNYEQDLQLLKEQQMKKAQADLEAQQKQSLSNLEAEISQIKPTYYAKKNSANVQSQVESKNFAEYLANSGRSNSGIGAQYEMSRRNNLQSSLNALNTEEANALTDVNRRKTDVNNAYESGLVSANAQIESDYITNLLNQRQLAWEREQQEKQFQESVRQYNEQMAYQRQQDSIANAQNWAKINGTEGTDEYSMNGRVLMENPYTKTINDDAKYGVFSFNGTEYGYQPNNVQGRKLSKSNYKVGDLFKGSKGETGMSLDSQNIWTDGSRYYVWDGSANRYNDVTNNVVGALAGNVKNSLTSSLSNVKKKSNIQPTPTFKR